MKRLFALVLVLLAASPRLFAQGVDDQYVRIYNLIQEADALIDSARPAEALPKYIDAQNALLRFQKANPDWNAPVVKFRISYLADKVTALSAKMPGPATTKFSAAVGTPPAQPATPAPPSDWENQLAGLREQVRQLQSETGLLETKLKEALSAQPAAVDPQELAKAQARIKSLQKENELLTVRLGQEKKRTSPTVGVDARPLASTQQALAEANRKLAEQTRRADSLAQEKQFLQNKLSVLAPGQENAAALAATRQALAEANLKLAQQTQLSARLSLEKDALQSRLTTLGSDSGALAALREENQFLKRQLADLKAGPANGRTDDTARQLAQAQAQVASLESDKEMLRLEKIALENRVRQLTSGTVPSAATPTVSRPEDTLRIRELTDERDALQKKLEAAIREQFGRKGKEPAAHVEELESQVATLRGRLEVFEARQVPYTAEELALFQQPPPRLAEQQPKTGPTSVKDLPAGTVALVADAQRHFVMKELDKAEEEYLQVLKQDEKNVYTLGNLAAIELERGRLDEAEKHIKRALAVAPQDAYSLSLLGQLNIRRGKYKDALDALSQAAKLDPNNAEIQNFLGISLSELGMRGPAETALRKAIHFSAGSTMRHASST
jgi:tetratricopeptide (TPR) repeat protein